jgi:hypothetical protein
MLSLGKLVRFTSILTDIKIYQSNILNDNFHLFQIICLISVENYTKVFHSKTYILSVFKAIYSNYVYFLMLLSEKA